MISLVISRHSGASRIITDVKIDAGSMLNIYLFNVLASLRKYSNDTKDDIPPRGNV